MNPTTAAAGEQTALGQFPDDFVWGVSTAAYQIEGATREDGRGPSIWDTFARTPGKVFAGHTGDVACEHYFRYTEDVALMARLGLRAYRFSIAWPRVRPDGSGPTSNRGLDFYDRLVDTLLGHDITPYPTLYHWDLPQALEDRGGWTVRQTAEHFAEYAASVHRRLGDRIETWTTLNEPWCAAFLGYAAGVHAPGRRDPAAAFAAAHHLLLAHGLATRALRADGASTVGITLNLAPVVAENPDDPHDTAAVRIVDGLLNRWFLEPLLRGHYPDDAPVPGHDVPYRRDGDGGLIAAPIDLLGVNYYHPCVVAARPGATGNPAYPGSDGIEFRPATGPVTAMGWPIEPWGLTEILVRLATEYPHVPLLVTENGAAFDDRPDPVTGEVVDPERTRYLEAHLRAAQQARALGADLRGYLVWSLLDNFEWAEGYRKRFGLVYVDYATQQRVPKSSAWWFRDVIRRGGLEGGD
jgi:beta-glucosidase